MIELSKAITAIDEAITITDPALKNMVKYVDDGKYNDAIKWIQNKAKEEEQTVTRTEVFEAYPADGAHAFTAVLRKVYGWIEQRPVQTFWGDKPPVMLVVETGPYSRTEVPWGRVAVPNIDGEMVLGAKNDQGVWKFTITGNVKKKHLHLVADLCTQTRDYLKERSIYRGQPVRLEWHEDEGNAFTAAEAGFATPRFLVHSGLTKRDLILPQITYDEVNATIFSLIENSAKARRMNIPTKRLVLAAGPFGTGKTLTATITADICREHNRTFLYLRDVEHLADAIYFAQQYAPACVFAEDIDSVTDPGAIDKISNTIDGVDTKSLDILFILTTNHVERIPKKFLRSGRSDMIIKYTPPDGEAAARLIMRYGGTTLADGFTFQQAVDVGSVLAESEMIPASIREVVERSKLFALAKDRDFITKEDLLRASHGVIDQCGMLLEKRPDVLPDHLEEVGTLVRPKTLGAVMKAKGR